MKTLAQQIIQFSFSRRQNEWRDARWDAASGCEGLELEMFDYILDMIESPNELTEDLKEILSTLSIAHKHLLDSALEDLIFHELYKGDEGDEEVDWPTERGGPAEKPSTGPPAAVKLHDWQKPDEYDF